MIKKALDNKLLALIAIAMCSFFCVLLLRPTASGHTPHDACTMTQENRCNNFGFFSNKDTVYEGHELRGLGSITDYVNANDVNSFVNTVRNNLNNAPTFQTSPCLGAGSVPSGWPASGNPNDWPDCYAKKARGIHSAFLIATMLGKSGNDFATTAINNGDWNALVWARDNVNTWESRVRYYNTKGWVNFDYTQNFNCSTMGEQPSWNIAMYGYDMTWIPQCTSQPNVTYQTIHFNIPGVTGDTYTIVKSCGNAKGTLNTLNKVYNVESNLVEGPQGSGGNPNMPDASLPTVSYNYENNLIFNYGNGAVEDDRSYIRMTNATGYFATRVFAPVKITRNGVDWNLKGSDVCRANSDCRSSNSGEYKTLEQMSTQSGGDQNGRKYREIAAQHQTGSDMRVYWYYEAAPSPPSCTLRINGATNPVPNVPSSTSQVTLSWTFSNAARIVFSEPASLALGTKNSNGSQTVDLLGLDSSTTFKATPYSSATGGTPGTECDVTVAIDSDQPYLKAFGNDVSVGSAMTNCATNNAARIDAYVDASLDKGAGTQFAAHAPSTIKGFLSAVTRQNPSLPSPDSANGLTFGNSQNGTNKITPTSNSMGGNSSTTRCIPDYVAMARASVDANDGKVINLGATPSVANNAIAGRNTVFKQGSLIISGDLKYTNGIYNWVTVNDIPSLVIVVDGDVYIDQATSIIDPIIISSGTIYTCTSSAALNRTTMPTYPTCNNKLTINGAFIANSVKFWRTNGDVSDPAAATSEASSSANIAEVFNFSPEIYVGQMPELFKRTTAKKNYDYITSLPPTL